MFNANLNSTCATSANLYKCVPPRTNFVTHIDNSIEDKLYLRNDYNCIFINVHKNAGTSIRSWWDKESYWLVDVCEKCCSFSQFLLYRCMTCGTTSKKVEQRILDTPKFWVLRNPLTRIVSLFFSYLDKVPFPPAEIAFPPSEEEMELWLGWRFNENLTSKFNGFLESLKDFNFYEGHLFPQSVHLTHKNLSIEDVETIRFEHLQKDLEKFCKKNNIVTDNPIPVLNISKGKREEQQLITDYINSNQTVKEKIISLYPEDWEWYNKFKNSIS